MRSTNLELGLQVLFGTYGNLPTLIALLTPQIGGVADEGVAFPEF